MTYQHVEKEGQAPDSITMSRQLSMSDGASPCFSTGCYAPASSLPSESVLLEQITRAIQLRTGGCIRGLRLSVNEKCLVISGRTSTYYNKQLATHAIREAANGMTVKNELEVC